jgi:hypothetical protein
MIVLIVKWGETPVFSKDYKLRVIAARIQGVEGPRVQGKAAIAFSLDPWDP